MIYAVLIALQFMFLAFPVDMAWAIGWNVQSITIAALCGVIWHRGGHSAVAVLGLYSALTAILQWFGVTLESWFVLAAVISGMFALWSIKQVALMQIKSDPITETNYMYGLAPVHNNYGRFNILRPFVIAEYGGQAVRAGEHIYIAHRGKFKRVHLSELDNTKLDLYKWVDTGIEINNKDSKKLDDLLNDDFNVLYYNCSRLNVGVSLTYIMIIRFLKFRW